MPPRIDHLASRYNTDLAKLVKGLWPWNKGVRSRFPDHYKKCYLESFVRQPEPINWIPKTEKYKEDEWGHRIKITNYPIPLTFPKEAHRGIWGGEGIIDGLKSKNNRPDKPRAPFISVPKLERHVLYSEILDKYMAITVTRRTLLKIDEAYGFDHYILKTPESDLISNLGMKLKQMLLLKIAKKKLSPTLYEKYKQYEVPIEEAEWIGLTIEEAEEKQIKWEEERTKKLTRPMKEYFLEDLIKKLKSGNIEDLVTEEKSWTQKLNPFA